MYQSVPWHTSKPYPKCVLWYFNIFFMCLITSRLLTSWGRPADTLHSRLELPQLRGPHCAEIPWYLVTFQETSERTWLSSNTFWSNENPKLSSAQFSMGNQFNLLIYIYYTILLFSLFNRLKSIYSNSCRDSQKGWILKTPFWCAKASNMNFVEWTSESWQKWSEWFMLCTHIRPYLLAR